MKIKTLVLLTTYLLVVGCSSAPKQAQLDEYCLKVCASQNMKLFKAQANLECVCCEKAPPTLLQRSLSY